MKKTTFLLLCATFYGLSVVTMTVKGINFKKIIGKAKDVGKLTEKAKDLGKVAPKVKAAFVDIKNIIESSKTTIDTIKKEMNSLKTIKAKIKGETSPANRLKKQRQLIIPSRLMLTQTLSTVELFIRFIDNHLDEVIKIFDKNAGQKLEDFARKLKGVIQDVNTTLLDVLTTLEPEQKTIDALQLRPAQQKQPENIFQGSKVQKTLGQ